jgi:hypothetical protein
MWCHAKIRGRRERRATICTTIVFDLHSYNLFACTEEKHSAVMMLSKEENMPIVRRKDVVHKGNHHHFS